MATGTSETLGELYARIGINFDDLERNFVQVDRTLQDNMARLNRQRNLINLQARIDLMGLDEAADATRIFEIRQRSLQQQIETQRARLQVLSHVLDDARDRTGDLSDETQRAQIQYEQARLSLRRLETQLENLNETQNETAQSAANWQDTLKDVVESGRLIGALENIQGAISAIADETQRSIEKFRELQTQSYELNMPFQKTRDFLREIRLAGGDIGDFEGYIRGITDAYVKGEVDDPEFIALDKYGAKITDATGRLKDFKDITEEVYQAYLKAKAAGEEIEFLQLTGGESGVRDAIQLFERYGEAREDAAKIFKANIDEAAMHDAERSLNLLTEQFEELRVEVSNLFTPATIDAANKFFTIFRDATKWIQENSDALKSVGSFTFDVFANMPSFKPAKEIWDYFTKSDKSTIALENSMSTIIKRAADMTKALSGDGNPLSQYGIQRVNQFSDELEDLRLELDFEDEFERRIAEINLWRERELTGKLYVSNEERQAIEELYAAKIEQVYRDKAEAIQKIEEEQAEKVKQIREQSAERTKNLIEETADIQFAATHSAFEKEIRDIENWKQKQLEALDEYRDAVQDKNAFMEEAAAITANALAKETEAFEKEMDRIRGKTQSLAEKIFEQEHSRRDVDIMRAQKERAELYAEGIYPREMIERYFGNELAKIGERAMTQGGSYNKAPTYSYQGKKYGYETVYGDWGTARLPSTDFYGNIQKQVEQYMNQAGSPAQKLQEQFQQSLSTVQTGLDQSAQNLVQATENLSTSFKDTFSNFNYPTADFSQVSNSLSNVSQRLADIAQNSSKPPVVNISPNINVNVDLGGAYVFDDNMKAQLTDDITSQVANAVTDAVQKATSQASYGYGN